MSDQTTEVVGGRYRVLETLGKGAMGVVYRAHDPVLDRMVAIKRMTAEIAHDPSLRQRFYVEARAAARLNHRNIVTVYELGETDQDIFIVMELVEGTALSQLIRQQAALPITSVVDLMAQVCDGLDFAHRNGIVHRDIKPANLNVLPSGLVKILDFGIARLGSVHMTASGILIGTPDYMAPEQARGEDIDGRADLFSVGAVIYELVSTIKPFAGGTLGTVITRLIREPHMPLRQRAPSTPAQLGDLVDRLLAKDRRQRPATAGAVRDELQAIGEALRVPSTRASKWDEEAGLEPTLVGIASPPADIARRGESGAGTPAGEAACRDDAAAQDATSAPGVPAPPSASAPPPPEPTGVVTRAPRPEDPEPPTAARPATTAPAAAPVSIPPSVGAPAGPATAPSPGESQPARSAATQDPTPQPQPHDVGSSSRRGHWTTVAAAILLLAVGGGGYFWWQDRVDRTAKGTGPVESAALPAGAGGAGPAQPQRTATSQSPAPDRATPIRPDGGLAEVRAGSASAASPDLPPAAVASPGAPQRDSAPAPSAEGAPLPRTLEPSPLGGVVAKSESGPPSPRPPEARPSEGRSEGRGAEARTDPGQAQQTASRARAELTGETLDAFARPSGGDAASLARSAALVAAENRVRYVIGRYAEAFGAQDSEALNRVRPALSPAESAWMAPSAKVSVRVENLEVQATETEGIARGRRQVEGQLASGAAVREDRTVTFRLLRRPTGWVIVEVR